MPSKEEVKKITSEKEIDRVVNMYSTANEIPKTVKGMGSNVVGQKELIDKLRSANGLTQKEAGILICGSEDNYKRQDPDGSSTRGKIRKLWSSSISPDNEVSVSHTGSDENQVYFIVSKMNFKHWYKKFILDFGYKEKLDTTKRARNIDVDKLVRS